MGDLRIIVEPTATRCFSCDRKLRRASFPASLMVWRPLSSRVRFVEPIDDDEAIGTDVVVCTRCEDWAARNVVAAYTLLSARGEALARGKQED